MDADFARRRGAVQVTAALRWVAEHPAMAREPVVVHHVLQGYLGIYGPSAEERERGILYVEQLLSGDFFNSATLRQSRYPQGGPSQLERMAYEVLVWAALPEKLGGSPGQAVTPRIAAQLAAAGRIHAGSPTRNLVLHADRQLAAEVRSEVLRENRDPRSYQDALAASGFAVVPVDDFLRRLKKEQAGK